MNLYEMAGPADITQAPPPCNAAFVLPGGQLHVLGEIQRIGADRTVSILAREWAKTVHQAGSTCDVFEAAAVQLREGSLFLRLGKHS